MRDRIAECVELAVGRPQFGVGHVDAASLRNELPSRGERAPQQEQAAKRRQRESDEHKPDDPPLRPDIRGVQRARGFGDADAPVRPADRSGNHIARARRRTARDGVLPLHRGGHWLGPQDRHELAGG